MLTSLAIIGGLIVLILIIYSIRREIIFASVHAADNQLKIGLNKFPIVGMKNEASYSIWFNVKNWKNYQGTTDTKEVRGTRTNEKILFQQTDSADKIQMTVTLGSEVNTLNVFLPEITDFYRESINCKITAGCSRRDNG